MGHWRSDMNRHRNNERQRERDREEHGIREDIQRTLQQFEDAEPSTVFKAMGFDTYELLRFASLVVQFQGSGDSRELEPAWRREFGVVPPVATADDWDGDDMEGPRRLRRGWFEEKIFKQVLDQATDYEGALTPTSFDPTWLIGIPARVLREESTRHGFEIAAVRKREDGWMVFLRKKARG